MARSGRREHDDDGTAGSSSDSADREPPPGEGTADWIAASTLRVGLALVGIVLLLFALGQVAGIDILGMAVDALSSSVGRWLVVALFALVLIALAARGFGAGSD